MLIMIVGPMKSEKTSELNRLINRAIIAKKNVKVFYPAVDTRNEQYFIQSRDGSKSEAIKIFQAGDILNHVSSEDNKIFIDEIQLWDDDIEYVVKEILDSGKEVICAGLDLDFRGEPFSFAIARLLCLANKVIKLTSICEKCGSEQGRMTFRLVDGKPASFDGPIKVIEGSYNNIEYQSLCNKCYRDYYRG